MFLLRRKRAPTYAYAAGATSADAGQRQTNRLLAPGQHHYLDVTVEGDLIQTVAAGTILNRGSILAAFDLCGIIENGQDRRVLDPRIERFYSETRGDSGLSNVRLASNAIATTHLKETFRVYFADRRQLRPRETAFLVKDPRADFFFFHQLNNTLNGYNKICSGANGSLQNVRVSVIQRYADTEVDRPYFLPVCRQISQDIVAANGALDIPLRPEWPVRALVIQQDANFEVNDIINKIALRGDTREIIGPELIEFNQLARDMESEYGGGVFGPSNNAVSIFEGAGYLIIEFPTDGRLNTILNPAQDTNLRLVVDCQPTVTALAANSKIRVGLIMLEHDNTRVDANGRPLVDPVDFAY